jgi:hypothetical protein
MKRVAVGLVIAACALTLGCGEADEPSARREISLQEAPALFAQDFRNAFENSYRVAYDLEVTDERGETNHCTLEWWKDGTERQRFDMCPPLVFGDEFDSEPWRILMFGDREQILVCSSRLTMDPRHEGLEDEGTAGACHEDSTGIGDLAGNAVYFLNFPLEYPDQLPPTYFDRVDEIPVESAWEETIAGVNARCYAGTSTSDADGDDVPFEFCYAENGALVSRTQEDGLVFGFDLRATSVGEVTDSDFEPPYAYVDASVVD